MDEKKEPAKSKSEINESEHNFWARNALQKRWSMRTKEKTRDPLSGISGKNQPKKKRGRGVNLPFQMPVTGGQVADEGDTIICSDPVLARDSWTKASLSREVQIWSESYFTGESTASGNVRHQKEKSRKLTVARERRDKGGSTFGREPPRIENDLGGGGVRESFLIEERRKEVRKGAKRFELSEGGGVLANSAGLSSRGNTQMEKASAQPGENSRVARWRVERKKEERLGDVPRHIVAGSERVRQRGNGRQRDIVVRSTKKITVFMDNIGNEGRTLEPRRHWKRTAQCRSWRK